jgi:glycosyltransferase involved in cell wall biosynthesis
MSSKMKILLLADAWSSHTMKWANSLHKKGIEVSVFSLSGYDKSQYCGEIKIEVINFSKSIKTKNGSFLKLAYMTALPRFMKFISGYKPTILHAHSASSYGFIGTLSGFHPYFISVWGSDVEIFPKKSFVHKKILNYSLSKADALFSTSKFMGETTANYTDKPIKVLNFGVDLEMFKTMPVKSLFNKEDIVIGTVKTLDYSYGIENLIRAFAELKKKYPSLPLKLLLVGGGGMIDLLKEQVNQFGLAEHTVFTGLIPFSETPLYHNMMDIEIFPSLREGFGVSIVEASACEKPVVASNVGGIPEIVDDGITGFLIPPGNLELLVYTLEKFILSPELRAKFGKAGRERVKKLFDWNKNLDEMIFLYNKFSRNKFDKRNLPGI